MALKLPVFKTRALSAVIFVAIMLTGLLYNQWTFLALFSVIHFGCWWEFNRLIEKIDNSYKNVPAFIKFSMMLFGYSYILYMCSPQVFPFLKWSIHEIGYYLLLGFGGILLLSFLFFFKKFSLQSLLSLLAGFLYISLSWGLMMKLRSRVILYEPNSVGLFIPLTLIASIWVNDTMAYIIGSLFGRRQLSSYSPKKTWEGTIGGIILAVIVISYGGHALMGLPFRILVLVSFLATIMGTFGDLLESRLKRLAGVKDSGSILPGHGGFLDRFDSLLLATPYVWLFADMFI
jgi:phosphatidate cytidylyltransferase